MPPISPSGTRDSVTTQWIQGFGEIAPVPLSVTSRDNLVDGLWLIVDGGGLNRNPAVCLFGGSGKSRGLMLHRILQELCHVGCGDWFGHARNVCKLEAIQIEAL